MGTSSNGFHDQLIERIAVLSVMLSHSCHSPYREECTPLASSRTSHESPKGGSEGTRLFGLSYNRNGHASS